MMCFCLESRPQYSSKRLAVNTQKIKMRVLLLLWALVASACAESDTQYVQSVKGGGGWNQYQDKFTEYWSRFNSTQMVDNNRHEEVEVGVCYIEVPTINLVPDSSNVPTGNGSRSDMSRIRSCCAGYTKNRHNPMVCDPVCSRECINALCVAPETCKCYPDYTKNRGGFCVPTCPIGCQNGHCAGGECICNNGYKLDRDGKFCMPTCKDGCGSSGNCTAPNTCSCSAGLQATSDGSCKPMQTGHESPKCDDCNFGQCIGDQICRCHPGYTHNSQGRCTPQCNYPCSPGSSCVAPNVCSPSTTGNGTGLQYFISPITTRPMYPDNQVTNTPTDNQNPNSTPNYPQNYGYYPNGTRRHEPEPGQYPQSNRHTYPVSPRPGQHPQSHPNTSRGDLGPNSNQNPQSIYYGIYPSLQDTNGQRYPNRGDIESQTNQDTQSHYIPNLEPQRPNEYYPGTSSNQPNNSSQRPYPYYGQVPDNTPQGQRYPYNQRPDTYNNYGNQVSNNTPNYPSNGSNYPQSQYNPSQGYPNTNQGTGMPLYPGNQQQYNPQGNYNNNQGTYPGYYPNNQYPNNDQYYSNYPNSSGHKIEVSSQVSNESRSHNQSNSFYTREGNRYNSNYPTEDQQTDERVPICSLPCINGYCVEGNECMCNQGYIRDRVEPNKCLPNCPGGCPNGVCSAPRMCLCNVGYHKDTSIKGRQVCVKSIR